MTAELCRIGMEFRAKTLPMIIASLKVQFPLSQRGNKNPLKKAPGLKSAFLIA